MSDEDQDYYGKSFDDGPLTPGACEFSSVFIDFWISLLIFPSFLLILLNFAVILSFSSQFHVESLLILLDLVIFYANFISDSLFSM